MKLFRSIFNYRMLVTLVMGFASGLPLLLTGQTLQAWMTDSKVDLSVLGYFSLVGIPYSLKFLWAPFFDRYELKFLGRRRGWLLICQILLAAAIAFLGWRDPAQNLQRIAILAFLVAFFSATQDILIDSYRRELLPDAELSMGASVSTFGYRMAVLFSGAFALYLSDHMPWSQVYWIMSGTLAASVLITIFSPEPAREPGQPKTLMAAVVEPLKEFFSRPGAWGILTFILFYKLGDNMAGALTVKFIKDLGYSNTDLATMQKVFGMIALLAGGFLGGALVLRMGLYRSLWLFGILQSISTIGFSVLANVEHTLPALAVVIGIENFTTGMGTSAYSGFMASLANRKFTATQYALLTSLMAVSRTVLTAPSGDLVKWMGWSPYFAVCALLAAPGLLVLTRFKKDIEKY